MIVLSLLTLCGCSGNKPELGISNGQLKECPETPNCVSSQTVDAEHYIEPIYFSGTKNETKERLLEILKESKRVKIITQKSNYIHAEFTSALFRFVDDVEFYFPEEQAERTIIHVRSASRIGHSDLGANKKRIEIIRSKLTLDLAP